MGQLLRLVVHLGFHFLACWAIGEGEKAEGRFEGGDFAVRVFL